MYADLISQNGLQMYFFCRNNIDLKYTSFFCNSSGWSILEVYFKYSYLKVYLKYALKYTKYASNILWKYTSSILHFSKGIHIYTFIYVMAEAAIQKLKNINCSMRNINWIKKSFKTLWPLFMDGVQLFQCYRAITRR